MDEKYDLLGIALLPDKKSEGILDNELKILRNKYSLSPLSQPIHITLKRPFQYDRDITTKFTELISDISLSKLTLETELSQLSAEICVLKIVNKDKPLKLHKQILKMLSQLGVEKNKFEGNDYIPHITVGICNKNINISFSSKSSDKYDFDKIGLLGHDTTKNKWEIIKYVQIS